MNLSMIASSWSMSIAMLLLASSSWTLISASRRRRDSGVRRSCEMPASMTARSCSTLASSRAIRLKPMLTWRISLVIVVSSRRESYSPSRMRLAANERSLSGRLMRRAMPAEPSTVASRAIETQRTMVLVDIGPTRVGSTLSQNESRAIEKPTQRPGAPFIELATIVSGPSWSRSSRSITRWKRSISNGSHLSFGSRGVSLTDSSVDTLLMMAMRLMPSVPSSAARVMLTRLAICCAACTARGSNSRARKVCTHANTPLASSTASRKNVRQKRLRATNFLATRGGCAGRSRCDSDFCRGRRLPVRVATLACGRDHRSSGGAVRHEDVADAPHRLDVARLRRVGLDHLPEARDLHVEAAVEGLELAAARELRELVARQRLARMSHQCLQHRELAGREGDLLAVLGEPAQCQVEHEGAEADGLGVERGRARRFHLRPAPQHGVDAGEQLARIEGFGKVVVGADLEADDAVDILDLGGEHDDRRHVVGGAQAPADRQAVLAGQHQVEDDEVHGLARQQAVERLGVFGQQHLETLLRQIASQQVANTGIIVDDDDAVRAGVGGRVHRFPICNNGDSARLCGRFE